MDIRKLISDVFTGNTGDLKKRFDLLKRKIFRFGYLLLNANKSKDLHDIPVIINNRNRYTYLLQLISWLEQHGMKNIIILDNESNYPPLLDYYNTTNHKVVFLKRNAGPRALWEESSLKKLISDYYIYTDPDVVPDKSASFESIQLMYDSLKSRLGIDKIGFALRIDNLPDSFKLRKDVMNWEEQFWNRPLNDQLFIAPVDTTFALYAPYASGGGECKAYRTNFPHVALHMPWYENSVQPTEEDEYYRAHAVAQNSHWTELTKSK